MCPYPLLGEPTSKDGLRRPGWHMEAVESQRAKDGLLGGLDEHGPIGGLTEP